MSRSQRHTMRPGVIFLLGLVGSLTAAAWADPSASGDSKQSAESFSRIIPKQVTGRYLLYLPRDYQTDQSRRWPVILFLHGAGERGNDLKKVKKHGPPKLIENGRQFPAIIVSPQCPAKQWWNVTELTALLDHIAENYRVDDRRIYLTGLSMGGYGSWALAASEPDRFAAVAPICGGGDPDQAAKLKSLPIRAYHGSADQTVKPDQSRQMVDAVNKAGGNATLTIYQGVGHDSWSRTYDDPEFWKWLFQQRRPDDDDAQSDPNTDR